MGQTGQDSSGGCCTWTKRAKTGWSSGRSPASRHANNHESYNIKRREHHIRKKKKKNSLGLPRGAGGKYRESGLRCDSQVAARTKRAPALVVLKVSAGRPGALLEHLARDEVRSHWSARGDGAGLGSLEGPIVVGRAVSRERRGARLGWNAVWMLEYELFQIR